MAEPLRLFISAGEASGDRLGADLIAGLKARTPVEVSGIGGAEMAGQGLKSLFPITDLSVMGWSDVLRRLPLLLWRLRQTARAIVAARPDVVVLIDSQVFSKAVASRVRKAGFGGPLLLYVAPSVWGYHPERAAALRPLFDEVLAVLPMEPAVMAKLGGPPTSFVGHPATRRMAFRPAQPERGSLLLLPGSREGEIRRHIGLMRAAAEGLAAHPRVSGFVIPTLSHLADGLRREVAAWSVPVEIVTGDARRRAFETAIAAFAVSGTITLELAMLGVPMVVTYVADRRQAQVIEGHGTPPLALPSIIAGRRVVPELVFTGPPEPGRAVELLRGLLDTPGDIAGQRAAFEEIRRLLETGASEAPIVSPAERVLAQVGRRVLG
jgi:lipid-A-disaccharide synthase